MNDANDQGRHERSWDFSNPDELHRVLFEEATDGMFVTDLNGRYVAVNPRGTELAGYSREELLGMNITDLIPPKDLARDPIRMGELRQGGIVTIERRIRRKDGSLLPVEISARMLPSDNLLGIVRDISERKRAETGLRESEEKYRALIETTGTGYVILDNQGRVIDANQEYAHLAGRQELEDVIGHSVLEWTASRDLERNAAEIRKCIEQGFVRNLEIEYVAPSGRVIPVEIDATVLGTSSNLRILTLCRDITLRRQAEEAMRARENLLSSVFRAAPIGIGMVSKRVLLAVNDRLCEMIGWKREELIGKSARVLYPSDAQFEYVGTEKYRQIGEHGTGAVETRWRCKDGRIIDVLLSSTPINSLDMTAGVTFTALDITERKKAEAALRKSEERLRLALKAANQGLYDLNVQTGEGQVSPEYATMLGYDPAEFQETRAAWLDRLHQDDRKTVIANYRDYVAGKIPAYQVEFRQRTKSGDWKWILSLGKIVEWDALGQPLRMLGTHTDITERKEVEKALRDLSSHQDALLAAIPDVVMEVDANKVYTWANQAGLDFFGEDAIGREAADYFEGEQDTYEAIDPLFRGQEDVIYVQSWQRRRDGQKRLLAWWCRVLKDAAGNVTGAISTARDITERMREEEEKDALQAQLLQAQKMESVARLAGGVAHDFNNMLSAILGHAELAIMACAPSEPIHADLKAIQESALRSADLIRQLLAFARKQTVAPKVLDINDTVAGMLKMLLRLMGEDMDLVWMPGAGLWSVRIDPSQIDQLLANLCVNARDAIAGVGKVTIETENITFDKAYCATHPGFACGEYVMLAVSDDGCGMSKEVLDRLFEPFFTTKEVGKGTGLGLATVYGIVKQNDGFINVYSEPGKGSTFKIYLPRFAGEGMEPTTESTAETPKGRGETVLLVEDEAAILHLGRKMLEWLGYSVLTAGTPGEALRLAEAHAAEIQLLITDVVMPEMNGRELAKRIDHIKPCLKCLFTSGYTANVIAHHGVLDEGVCFLQKPFSIKEVAFKVREALERK
jgi:two-component system, cell cycle sensor histidine kinase and response regulator CckA